MSPPAKTRRFAAPSRRLVASAGLAAMIVGIVVNAVALQHGKRIDLGPDPTAAAAAPVAAPAPKKIAAAPPAAAPHAAPTPVPTTVVAAAPPPAPKSGDAIADLLRTQAPDKRRLTLNAQKALAKLGFSVKPTGALDGATRKALADFAKAHHGSASPEITAKLVKTLTAAAKAE